MDYYRLVFDRLLAAGVPDGTTREQIYEACRTEVKNTIATDRLPQELDKLEKVIIRQEMQALYEESDQRRS